MNNRNSNRRSTNNNNLKSLPKGGVSLEIGRGFRGEVTVNGNRYRTRRYKSRTGALRELRAIRAELMETL